MSEKLVIIGLDCATPQLVYDAWLDDMPNIKKLGLLTPRVRKAFEELEIIHFETYDPEAADREIGLA